MRPRSAKLPLTPGPPLDVVIIGAGQAGIPLAHALAKAGKRVAIAERKDLGGSCVNFGCTPTKAVVASARAAYLARRAAVFGLRVPRVEIDFPAVLDRARSILMDSRAGIRRGFEKSDNPRLVRGHARLEGREGRLFRIRIGKESLRARQVVLDTGTRSDLGSIRGLSSIPFLHASNWLDQTELPRHILFAGGGYIALEMGQFYRRMGSRVTIVDGGDQILKSEDRDIVERLQHLLESEGIQFRLNCRVTRVVERRGGLAVTVEKEGAREVFTASHLFVSAGRLANTDDLGLETVGLKPGAQGVLRVDERLATRVPGIWAAGDIRGGPMFTHTSWDDHRILLSQLAGDGKRTTRRRIVPYAVYTDPELGRVGATEEELRKAGRDIRVGRFEMRGNGKARERSETRGCIKVVVDAKTKKLLGASVLASDGSELVHVYVALMNADVPVSVLRDAIQIHPTLSEALQSAVGTLV
jgi:pyruvate/2-oxoglutarate dehydrogenase complex dihydrolipoamide dehydrogenase (E3) component